MKKTIKKEKIINFAIALLFILIAAGLRLIPHAPNFTPLAAMALFGGFYFSKRIAFVLPLAAMFISDLFIGFYEPKLMMVVYGSFVLCVALGFWLKSHKNWYTIGAGAVLSSVLFFITTNLAVWAFAPWYAKTLSGMIQCFVLAIPFFKNTLLGDLFYTGVFFGAYELVKAWVKNRSKAEERSAVLAESR